jgi:hypothetical protein
MHSYDNDIEVYSVTIINDRCFLLNAMYQLKIIDLNTF